MKPKTQTLLHELVDSQVVPGVSYAFLAKGKLQTEVFGASQIVPEIKPLLPNQLYDVASLTKVIGTTTVILKLWQEGKLAFDDPISQYLPRFKDPRVTIRHLLTHTSAISGYIKNRNQLNAQQLLTALYQLPVCDWLGQKVVYADVGLIFLGEIIEHFYGRAVQEVITTEVLAPLAMFESTFTPKKEQCVPTEFDVKKGLLQGRVHDPKAWILKEHCGSAGLFSSLNDLVKFASALLFAADKHPILSQETIDLLFFDQTPNHHLKRSFGWDLRYNKAQQACLYHTGFTGTWMLLDQQKQEGLIVLTNRIHPSSDNQLFLQKREIIVQTYLNED